MNECKALLAERYRSDGFNVGINVGPAAGQTVFHVHIHLIPPLYWRRPQSKRRRVAYEPRKGYY
ncbi:MAG TPA: HIT domain-containing protein [Candidatus Eisenbacteria bacterium]|nr:HIT domain-containing protein [Candidatus Eisenbacteria bacterium]